MTRSLHLWWNFNDNHAIWWEKKISAVYIIVKSLKKNTHLFNYPLGRWVWESAIEQTRKKEYSALCKRQCGKKFFHSEATEHVYRYIKRESRVREESAPSESVMWRSKIKYAYLRLTHKSTKLFFTKPFSPWDENVCYEDHIGFFLFSSYAAFNID